MNVYLTNVTNDSIPLLRFNLGLKDKEPRIILQANIIDTETAVNIIHEVCLANPYAISTDLIFPPIV